MSNWTGTAELGITFSSSGSGRSDKRKKEARPNVGQRKSRSSQIASGFRPVHNRKASLLRPGTRARFSSGLTKATSDSSLPHGCFTSTESFSMGRGTQSLRSPSPHALPDSIPKSSGTLITQSEALGGPIGWLGCSGGVIAAQNINGATRTSMQHIGDTQKPPSIKVPYFIPDDQAVPRINTQTLLDLMDGKFTGQFDDIIIIDCRFKYEFDGGHINGAVHCSDEQSLLVDLFKFQRTRTALVLHCEYSAYRAPMVAKRVRQKDRAINIDTYPNLTCPGMYILNGGYSAFFAEQKPLCTPQNYVGMKNKDHKVSCERDLRNFRQRHKHIL